MLLPAGSPSFRHEHPKPRLFFDLAQLALLVRYTCNYHCSSTGSCSASQAVKLYCNTAGLVRRPRNARLPPAAQAMRCSASGWAWCRSCRCCFGLGSCEQRSPIPVYRLSSMSAPFPWILASLPAQELSLPNSLSWGFQHAWLTKLVPFPVIVSVCVCMHVFIHAYMHLPA